MVFYLYISFWKCASYNNVILCFIVDVNFARHVLSLIGEMMGPTLNYMDEMIVLTGKYQRT